MTTEPTTWHVLRFLHTRRLPKFTIFANESWTTYRDVAGSFVLAGAQLEEGRDYKILYTGPRSGCQAHELPETPESRAYFGARP